MGHRLARALAAASQFVLRTQPARRLRRWRIPPRRIDNLRCKAVVDGNEVLLVASGIFRRYLYLQVLGKFDILSIRTIRIGFWYNSGQVEA